MKIMKTKFAGRCRETKHYIMAGEVVIFDPERKHMYKLSSKKASVFFNKIKKFKNESNNFKREGDQATDIYPA